MSEQDSLLVVDDSIDNLKLMAGVLREAFTVHLASSGEDALEYLDTWDNPDLILLDIMMPDLDGYQVLERLKANPATCEIPVIFVTGRTDGESELHGFALGAVDYLTKPIAPPLLLARVRAHLALARQNAQTRRERDEIAVLAAQLAQEVAERKARETRLRTLSEVVEKSPVSVLITDAQGGIIYINSCFTTMMGYRLDEILGQNPRLFKSGQQDHHFYRSLWTTLNNGETWRGDIINKTKQGALIWLSAVIFPITDDTGRTQHFVGIHDDISDRKKLERIKDDVERIMRHDLKNPLNTIIAMPDLLLLDDSLNEEQCENIGLIKEAGAKMATMIDMSLDLYKMETGSFHYEPQRFNLVPILEELIRSVSWSLLAKTLTTRLCLDGQQLDAQTAIFVCADARLLSLLLQNLLANAIDASPDGETLWLDITSLDTCYRLTLRNRGAVPVPMRACFFDKYSTHGKARGTGLGTYSAKLIADTLGCELCMETSDHDDSTSLHLSIPTNSESRLGWL